jgi:hypothetical protein
LHEEKEQVQRGKALLTIDELLLIIVALLHDDWLKAVVLVVLLLDRGDIVEEGSHFVGAPSVPSLIGGDQEVLRDLADGDQAQIGRHGKVL